MAGCQRHVRLVEPGKMDLGNLVRNLAQLPFQLAKPDWRNFAAHAKRSRWCSLKSNETSERHGGRRSVVAA